MNEQKSLLTELSEAIDRYRAGRRARRGERGQQESSPARSDRLGRALRWFTPNGGTILLVLVLIATQSVWARSMQSTTATSTSTISYQGRLADTGGEPLTGLYNMEFRIYDAPDGGVPLWEEFWTGGNSVQVSDGLFNVMLGSIETSLAAAIEGHDELYLGITVGTDSEMTPRVQLGSVPFSMQALTVPDGSINGEKLGTSFGSGLNPLLNFVPRSRPVTPDLQVNEEMDWTVWDVSSIVGDTATAVEIYVRVADDTQGSYAMLRMPGASGGVEQTTMAGALHIGKYKGYGQYTITCDENQHVEHKVWDNGDAPIEAQFWIVGWYEPANR